LADALDGEFDLVADYALPLPAQVICEIMGVPMDRYPQFRTWTGMFLSTTDASAEARVEGYFAFMEYAAELVADHRAAPGDDLIDLLIGARDNDDRLTEHELTHTVCMFILAGYESTAAMISRGVFRLLVHPDQFAALAGNPALLAPATEEVLRSEGPGYGLFRLVTADLPVRSGTIPAGTVVLPNPYAANHDPRAFPDPDTFDIRRFTDPALPSHVTFGHGPHYCLGANLARMEVQEALRAIVTRLPELRLTIDPAEVAWTNDGLLHRPVRLSATR
jgi:cytochrome P450